MAYPSEDTAEFWDLVASGYRELLANPPKFIIPGIDRDTQYAFKIKEAEDKAKSLREPVGFPEPTEAFMESLEKKEAEIRACGAKLLEPKRSVSEEVWKRVLGLN